MPSSKLKESLAIILEREGYIAGFTRSSRPAGPGSVLEIQLKYTPSGRATIAGLKRVSRPGLRIYARADRLPRVLGGMGVAVLSTSQGLMTDREARQEAGRRGGALLCLVSPSRARGGALMSRVGRAPSPCPAASTVTLDDGGSSPSPGPRAPCRARSPGAITVRQEEADPPRRAPDDERQNRALHGLTRTLVANMVTGVTAGFAKELEIVGVGYRAVRQGRRARSSSRSASPTRSFVDAPEGITFEVPDARPGSWSRASTRRRSARSRPTSARSASPSPTRARASATSASVVLRKAGKAAK